MNIINLIFIIFSMIFNMALPLALLCLIVTLLINFPSYDFNGLTAYILFLYVTVFTMHAYPGYLATRSTSLSTNIQVMNTVILSNLIGKIYIAIFFILFAINFSVFGACILGILGYALSAFSLMVLVYVLNENPIRWLLGFVFSLIWPIFAFLLTIELPMFK